MMKDQLLKEQLYRHFRGQGWLAQLEVIVATSRRVSTRALPITDIDVLGIRPTHDLQWDTVVGDCKTKKKESPVNRVLWASGLKEGVGASSAIVLLERRGTSDIELDHKMFADKHHVTLLQQSDFQAYDRAINYPQGAGNFHDELQTVGYLLTDFKKRFPALAGVSEWALTNAWTTSDRIAGLRRTLGELRAIRGEIDPRRPDHMALVFECCVTFSVAFAELIGKVFRRHVQPEKRAELDEAVRMICWGGRDHYEFLEKVRHQAAPPNAQLQPLALPEWSRFLELIRTALDAPRLAFHIPQVMRRAGSGIHMGDPTFGLASVRNPQLLSLSLRVAEYVVRASNLPTDALDQVQNLFVDRLSVASRPTAAHMAQAPHQTYLFDTDRVPNVVPPASVTEEIATDESTKGEAASDDSD